MNIYLSDKEAPLLLEALQRLTDSYEGEHPEQKELDRLFDKISKKIDYSKPKPAISKEIPKII
jgi:heat shock protein HspQ